MEAAALAGGAGSRRQGRDRLHETEEIATRGEDHGSVGAGGFAVGFQGFLERIELRGLRTGIKGFGIDGAGLGFGGAADFLDFAVGFGSDFIEFERRACR